jgi:hypothetical protein
MRARRLRFSKVAPKARSAKKFLSQTPTSVSLQRVAQPKTQPTPRHASKNPIDHPKSHTEIDSMEEEVEPVHGGLCTW